MIELLYFTGHWCAACKRRLPDVERICDEYQVKLTVIDVDKDADKAHELHIQSIPAVIINRNDRLEYRRGSVDMDELYVALKRITGGN